MNDINRFGIVLLAATVIILATVVIFLTWTEYSGSVDMLGDFTEYLNAHSNNPAKLIITLSALTIAVVATLAIIIEFSPPRKEIELMVKAGDYTTIISADAIRPGLETTLLSLPAVVKANVNLGSRRGGITAILELTVLPQTNVSVISQEAISALAEGLQETGLLLSEAPRLYITFGEMPATDSSPNHETGQESNTDDQSS